MGSGRRAGDRRDLLQAMRASIRGYRDRARPYQLFLYWLGVVFLLGAALHTVVFLLDDRPWEGPLSWRKPLLFSFSFGLVSLSLGWVMTFLPRRPVAGWLLAGSFGVAAFGETFLIAMQAWRGTASHFNDGPLFDELVFAAMGMLIGVIVVAIVILAVWCLVSLRASPGVAAGIRTGMVLLVVGQAVGGMILGEGFRQLEAGPVGSPVVFGDRGDMNLPHAAALHTIQVLPLLGWLLDFSAWPAGRRTRVVHLGAVGYALLIGAAIAQAVAGDAPLDLANLAGAALIAGVLALAGAFVIALRSLRGARPAAMAPA